MKTANILKAGITASLLMLGTWFGPAYGLDPQHFGEDWIFETLNNNPQNPDIDVWWVKCAPGNGSISAKVQDESQVPGEPQDNALHVSVVCLAPKELKGKASLRYSDEDYGVQMSSQAYVNFCQEAFVIVQCELNNPCDHIYSVDLMCTGTHAYAKGFPKKTQ